VNGPQAMFVAICAVAAWLIFALLMRRDAETYKEALISSLLIFSASGLIAALCFGAVAVFLWLGEVKP